MYYVKVTLTISNISNFDASVSTLILRLKSKCKKTDATIKTFFKLLKVFFVIDVNSKFSKKNLIFQHITKSAKMHEKKGFAKTAKFDAWLNRRMIA